MNMPGATNHKGILPHAVGAANLPSYYADLDFDPKGTGYAKTGSTHHGFIFDANSTALLESVAINPNTPTSILKKLASHSEPEIRAAVAENSNAPMDIIRELVNDENPDVRYQLAENHHMPLDLLKKLAEDDNPYVACRAQRTIRRVEEALEEKRIGWTSFKRAQSLKGVNEIYAFTNASPINLLRRLCSSLYRYARAI